MRMDMAPALQRDVRASSSSRCLTRSLNMSENRESVSSTSARIDVWNCRIERCVIALCGAAIPKLAEQIGRSAAVRAVGLANGSNPVELVVPCHRVIGANGSLTGNFELTADIGAYRLVVY
jgi:O-6-methylguanine DNA methyltransferase